MDYKQEISTLSTDVATLSRVLSDLLKINSEQHLEIAQALNAHAQAIANIKFEFKTLESRVSRIEM